MMRPALSHAWEPLDGVFGCIRCLQLASDPERTDAPCEEPAPGTPQGQARLLAYTNAMPPDDRAIFAPAAARLTVGSRR